MGVNKMYYLTALLIIKNEDPKYLEEWHGHYTNLGVEHFYILNHQSTIPIPNLPNTTIWAVAEPRRQVKYYYEAIQKIDSYWVAPLDADEFIVCNNKLPNFLEQYEYSEALGINWLVFGSKPHKTKIYPVHGNYHWRLKVDNLVNTHIKSIVKTKAIKHAPSTPHYWHVKTVNEKHQEITTTFSPFSGEKIRINHYWSRSEEDYKEKIAKGRVDCDKGQDSNLEEINKICIYDPNPEVI